MKFDVDDKNRCRLVCVKFHLNRCRFAAAVAKCLRGSLFWGHSVDVCSPDFRNDSLMGGAIETGKLVDVSGRIQNNADYPRLTN